MLAGYLNHWGFTRFGKICTSLLDQFKGDQVTPTPAQMHTFVEDSGTVLFNYLTASPSKRAATSTDLAAAEVSRWP